MTIPSKILTLAEKFKEHKESYSSVSYNETQLRREFVDPFFKVLGWDVDNEQGYAEAYKDVIHEDSIKIGGATKAPDYCFRIGGIRKFFVETKKPSVNLKDDISPAFQVRRYAWSAKLPLSILTDFEEFAVYDCREKPIKTDKASNGRILYLTFDQYESKWDEIEKVFSKESILKGSFDKYAESTKGKRGTSEVDYEFLIEIERWRELLARNIALRNPELTQRELNFAVQRTIDRIIFLRICEDRGIEHYGTLMALLNGEHVYDRMRQNFRKADEVYNSGLFHFRDEKGRAEPPDTLTLALQLDDKPLKDIIKNLYYPESPYEFAVLPSDILGQVYERFLGSVIRLTKGHQAKVEEKPEVKKAGGVFYTPTYIVDYIVNNTVGKLIEGKSPKQIEKIKILDPACGSGSFLIHAYQFLLNYHLDWYIKDGKEKKSKGKNPKLTKVFSGDWRLSTGERKKILLNNIFGVDIDTQAVEVTKLSLLLKVLEGENEQSLAQQMSLFHERALPDLENNIKCGNSLISPDYFGSNQLTLFNNNELFRVNTFDWKKEFSDIFYYGGFDAIIGNPPYVDIKGMPKSDVEYIFSNFSCSNNRINLFSAFIEKSLRLLENAKGIFGMIIPTALLTQDSYKALRENILNNNTICNIVRLPNESFGDAAGDVKVDTVIVIIQKSKQSRKKTEIIAYSGYIRIKEIEPVNAHLFCKTIQKNWDNGDYVWAINHSDIDTSILSKCEGSSLPLVDAVDFCLGLTPYDKYKGHKEEQIKNRVFHSRNRKNKTFKPLLAGNDVHRYNVIWGQKEWISYGPWLGAPREQRFFKQPRILIKQIIDWTDKRIWASYTAEEYYNTQNAFNLIPIGNWDIFFLLGVINSKLFSYYHRKRFLDEFKMRFQKILIKDCKRLPIRLLQKDNQNIADIISEKARIITEIKNKIANTVLPTDLNLFKRQISSIDSEIDELVYSLYGLEQKEKKHVEDCLKKNLLNIL